jgi:quercetin dioxygenase-like cupin family protein
MRRLIVPTRAAVALALLLLLTGAVAAQNSTESSDAPAVTQIELTPGFVAEVFAGAPSDRAPDQTVYIARFTIQPGGDIFPHGHPGTTVLAVESGSLGWTLVEGAAYVVRGAGSGGTAVETVSEPGTEVILAVGDAIHYEDDVVHTMRNAGDETTVVLGTLILTTGAPLLMTAEEMAAMAMDGTPES